MSDLNDCSYCGEPEVLIKIKNSSRGNEEVCSKCYAEKVCEFCQDYLEDGSCSTCDDDRLCSYCNGSGEGYAPDSSCSSCGGSGVQGFQRRKQQEAEMRADYRYDQWKDNRGE